MVLLYAYRPLAGQVGESAVDGPSDGEAGRTGDASDGVLLAHRRQCPGSVRWLKQHTDCGRADWLARVPDGTGPAVLRCHGRTVGEVNGAEGGTYASPSTHATSGMMSKKPQHQWMLRLTHYINMPTTIKHPSTWKEPWSILVAHPCVAY